MVRDCFHRKNMKRRLTKFELLYLSLVAAMTIGVMTGYISEKTFAITLTIILVIVIYKAASGGKDLPRIVEMAVRFALDAISGKQTAIDADLNSGLIDESEAQRRRAEIQQITAFYGNLADAFKAGRRVFLIGVGLGFVIGFAVAW